MKPPIKEIIDELVTYHSTRKPTESQQKAFDIIGKPDFFILINRIMQWNKMVDMKTYMGTDPNILDIGSEVLYKKFVQLFDFYEPISTIYKLEKDSIIFSPNVSADEKSEILAYVNKNIFIPLSVHKTPYSVKRK